VPLFGIQHHYAHIGSVMAEHGLSGPVIVLPLTARVPAATAGCGDASSWSPASTGFERVRPVPGHAPAGG